MEIFDSIAQTLANNPMPLRQRHSDNSRAVADSWQNPCIREKRLTRHSVKVTKPDGTAAEYSSTTAAFRALFLPMEKAIKFRLCLKASGREVLEFDGRAYVFTLVPTVSAIVERVSVITPSGDFRCFESLNAAFSHLRIPVVRRAELAAHLAARGGLSIVRRGVREYLFAVGCPELEPDELYAVLLEWRDSRSNGYAHLDKIGQV